MYECSQWGFIASSHIALVVAGQNFLESLRQPSLADVQTLAANFLKLRLVQEEPPCAFDDPTC